MLTATKPGEYFRLATHKFAKHRGSPLEAWKVDETKHFDKEGLILTAYTNAATKQTIIAVTVLDTRVAQAKFDTLVEHTYNFAKDAKLKAENKGHKVSYVGFGIAGSIAEMCATQDRLPAFTFDSPANDHLRAKNPLNLTRYSSFQEVSPDNKFGNVFHIRPADDDPELRARFATALAQPNIPVSYREKSVLDSWPTRFDPKGHPQNIQTVNLAQPRSASASAESGPRRQTLFGYNPYQNKQQAMPSRAPAASPRNTEQEQPAPGYPLVRPK